jgi:molybdate transport system substrate-binding protein
MKRRRFLHLAAAAFALPIASRSAWAQAGQSVVELKAFFPAAMRSATAKIIPQFEQTTGSKALIEHGAVGALTARIQKGEPGDVVIVSEAQIDDLQKSGRVLPGTKVAIARVGIGVFVAKGVVRPDISSTEAFKKLLTSAKSISFGNPANGAPAGVHLLSVIDQLGLTSAVKPKILLATSGAALFDSVARSDVEIGFNQMTEIIAEDKVQLVGPLPSDIQSYTRFAGGLIVTSKQQEAGKDLLSYLSSSDAQSAMRLVGLDVP